MAEMMAGSIVPYFPDREWMEAEFGIGKHPAMKWRDLTRCFVPGAGGQPPVRLTVPIQGGASRVKKGRPEEWRISMQGSWPRVHLGAIEAAYASTPYFPHYFPGLKRIINEAAEGDSFLGFTAGIYDFILEALYKGGIREELRHCDADTLQKLRVSGDELRLGNPMEPDHAWIGRLFRLGPAALLTLV